LSLLSLLGKVEQNFNKLELFYYNFDTILLKGRNDFAPLFLKVEKVELVKIK
jgi:hypothetical protein